MSEKETHIDQINRDAHFNEAGRDNVQAGGDAVAGNKTEIHNNFFANSPNAAASALRDTSFLPYLLNRQKQEDDLVDALAQHKNFQRPLLCIIRGSDDDCCSERFVERIARNVLPQVPATKNQLKDGYEKSFIKTEFKNATELHKSMRRSLGESFIENKTATIADITAAFAAQKCPILLYATLSIQDCQQADGVATLHHFLEFWQNIELHQGHDYLILVCLFIYHQPATKSLFGGWFGKKDLNAQIEAALNAGFENCIVLEKLEPIQDIHLRNWAESDDVREFFNRSIYDDVREAVHEFQKNQKSEPLALNFLAKKLLQPLLEQLALKVKP